MKKLMKQDLRVARKFGNVFRFIDDLNAMNDDGEFGKWHAQIYPEEMELGKENNTVTSASFLDLDIEIIDSKFCVKLFDKRNAFPFSIVRMPYRSSNLPSSIFYASLGAEILRIARASNEQEPFIHTSREVLNRMKAQGAKTNKVSSVLRKVFGRHGQQFVYIATTSEDFLNKLLN